MSNPKYQLRLDPKILLRAKIILGSLLALVTIFIIGGIYQGVQSGDFDRIFVKPFREFGSDFQKAVNATPVPIPSLTPIILPSPTSGSNSTSKSEGTVVINQNIPSVKKAQPVSTCYKMNIREGEFASNKCYSQQDYEDLQYYLGRIQSAKLTLAGAEASMKITCEGSDQAKSFFKDSCERDKQQKGQAESDIGKYRGTIQGIIAKGQ